MCGPVRRFSFPKHTTPYKRTDCKQRRGTVLEDSIDEFLQKRQSMTSRNGFLVTNSKSVESSQKLSRNSKIPYQHLITEALESASNPLKFAEIVR